MAKQFIRVQRAVRTLRKPSARRGASSGRSSSPSGGGAGAGSTVADAPSIGQPVKVKTGYLWLSGNHGLDAYSDNTTSPLGVWSGTQGVVQSVRCDKILVSLKTNFSSRRPEFWVRKSDFWRLFESA